MSSPNPCSLACRLHTFGRPFNRGPKLGDIANLFKGFYNFVTVHDCDLTNVTVGKESHHYIKHRSIDSPLESVPGPFLEDIMPEYLGGRLKSVV